MCKLLPPWCELCKAVQTKIHCVKSKKRSHTAVGVFKTSLLHKQIKNHPNLAYKNSVRKCYEDLFFITNIQFNNPTSTRARFKLKIKN